MVIKKSFFNYFSTVLIFLAMFSTVFSLQDGVGLYFQLSAIFFIALSGMLCFAMSGGLKQPSRFEVVLFFSIISSFITSFLYGNVYSMQYTVVFFIFCLSASFIVRVHSLEELVKIYGFSAAIIIPTVFAEH